MPSTATTFTYERPADLRGAKTIVKLCRSDIMRADAQVVLEGGESNLHAHRHTDGFWMVLEGRVRFYGEGDVLLGELGPREGIHIPRGLLYWFESASAEPLEILHVAASSSDYDRETDRIDAEKRKDRAPAEEVTAPSGGGSG